MDGSGFALEGERIEWISAGRRLCWILVGHVFGRMLLGRPVVEVRRAVQDGLLHVANVLRDVDALRARLYAVEDGAAAPHAGVLVEDLEALHRGLVAAVEQE